MRQKFGSFRTAVCTREKFPSFFDLQSWLLVEENHTGASTSTHAENKMLYTERIDPVVVVDEAGRHAMEATNRSKTKGIIVMPTVVLDPLEARGV